MTELLILIALLISSNALSQNGFEDWDYKYKLIDIQELIETEREYAKKVEADSSTAQYYVAMEAVRFLAKPTGDIRDITEDKISSIKRVLLIKTGKKETIEEFVTKELELQIGELKVWMPIQDSLLEPFADEVDTQEEVLIYSLLTIEHHFSGGTTNSFLISEFTDEWEY